MRSPVLNFLLLVLSVSFNSTPDAIHEGPGVSGIPLEESLVIDPKQGSYSIGLDSMLVLVPTKADPSTKERRCKGRTSTIGAVGTSGVEMVLTLLTEVVVLHMGLTKVEVRETSFQRTSFFGPSLTHMLT